MGEEPLDQPGASDNAPDMSKLPTMTPEELRAIRAAIEISQREMAELLGVDLRTYQRWEGGERGIPGPVVLLARIRLQERQRK
jgi:DNA-binding transcriptional regulator YiaG